MFFPMVFSKSAFLLPEFENHASSGWTIKYEINSYLAQQELEDFLWNPPQNAKVLFSFWVEESVLVSIE